MSQRFPAVVRLSIHKENKQLVYFSSEQEARLKMSQITPPSSTLIDYFQLCRQDAVGLNGTRARDVLYVDIVKYFRWHEGRFRPRERNIPCVGRIYYTGIVEGDRYFLRLLLNHVKGPHSEAHLRTIDGITYSTCRAAAEKLGLLTTDDHHKKALAEASSWATGSQLRQLFSLILVHSCPSSPQTLLDLFLKELCEDIVYQWEKRSQTPGQLVIMNYTLHLIGELVEEMGGAL